MLGRWQPWHGGHFALFKRCFDKTGQVVIQVRDVAGVSGGADQNDNPFDFDKVCENIIEGLNTEGFTHGKEYIIQLVPNIVNITYGRKVGYKIEEESFEENISKISATKIRENMRKKGKI
ncbi:MAG: cytidyltransferase [Pelagibacteraceae bacterium]|nr:cytidyltransferase [Pelagibacteraceae bacterium]